MLRSRRKNGPRRSLSPVPVRFRVAHQVIPSRSHRINQSNTTQPNCAHELLSAAIAHGAKMRDALLRSNEAFGASCDIASIGRK